MPNPESIPATGAAVTKVPGDKPNVIPIGAAGRFSGKKPKAVDANQKAAKILTVPGTGDMLLLPTEAALILRISVKTLYHRVEMGLIRHYKIRGRLYLTASDIQDYIERHCVEPVKIKLGGGK